MNVCNSPGAACPAKFGMYRENLWGYKKRLEFIAGQIQCHKRLRKTDHPSLLDVGCGNGTLVALPLAEMGYSVLGVDVDRASVEKAVSLNPFRHAQFRLLSTPGDLLCLGKFDVVICSEVLEHLPDPLALLRTISQVVKDEGLVLVTTPNGYGPFEVENYVLRKTRLLEFLVRCKRLIPGKLFPEASRDDRSMAMSATENKSSLHVHFFRREPLLLLFERAGFKCLEFRNSTVLGGSLSNALLRRWPRLLRWNARLADHVPYFLASGWYFSLAKTQRAEQNAPSSPFTIPVTFRKC